MKWMIRCALLLLLLTGTSCEEPLFRSYDTAALPDYTGTMTWDTITDDASFSKRFDHASVSFDDRLWVMGGYDISQRWDRDSYMEDVWASTDGRTWDLMTDSASWNGRRGHAATVFDGYIYIAGGFAVDEQTKERGYRNDVYRSSDGITWDLISESNLWEPRKGHALVVSDGVMYLFGGMNNGTTYFDDMWKSEDGETWEQVPGETLPGKRAFFATTVDSDGVIYLIGGSFEDMDPSWFGAIDRSVESDWDALWSYDPSAVAPKWTPLASPRTMSACRADFSLASIGDTLILMPGRANSSYRFSQDDSAYSIEMYHGSTWVTDSIGPPLPPMYSYSSVIHEVDGTEKLFIIGGISDNGPQDDVYAGTLGGEL